MSGFSLTPGRMNIYEATMSTAHIKERSIFSQFCLLGHSALEGAEHIRACAHL